MDYAELFNDSYERVVSKNPQNFYTCFYDHFLAASPSISQLFVNTDMDKQREMLMISMALLISFGNSQHSNDWLVELADKHKNLHISAEQFDYWMDAIILTLEQLDSDHNSDYETAWRVILSPGLTFMKNIANQK